jgi:DNA-directed RNA polymerase subunit beta
VVSVRIDRKRKISATSLLRVLGYSTDDEIRELFSDIEFDEDHNYLEASLEKDPSSSSEEAYKEVYKKIRPGDMTSAENAKEFLEKTFFDLKRYDLSDAGRYKINQRLGIDKEIGIDSRVLDKEDIIETIREIFRLNNDPDAQEDDIDHLSNRRVRTVGELIRDKVRVGFLRMERIVQDRMSVADQKHVTPATLVNARPIIAILQEFYASSALSQFMNQTNPLAELEHKRTLSATGPGGLSRERAGFEVRDVHSSHYGRICPVETPEGQNIGLVNYLAGFSKINKYGFVETPYKKVIKRGKGMTITDQIEYLDAAEEEKYTIVSATHVTAKEGKLTEDRYIARKGGEVQVVDRDDIDYIEVSPRQILSISASLIPFLENTDGARALMAANMQRQATPLIIPEKPLVATGLEEKAAADSGQIITADEPGEVVEVSNSEIKIRNNKDEDKVYHLFNFVRSNQSTCIHHRPIVDEGEKVKTGQVIADNFSTDEGELALGQNLTVAFMSWEGANYEDAIVVCEDVVKNDRYTSIHIEEYEIDVRETRLGKEKITNDIPNVSEEALGNLDENGIIRIGAEVNSGDILVGKISPKGEVELSAEEKLLRAIFGEKAKDVKDSSLRLSHGEKGKVVGAKIFSKSAGDELEAGVYQKVKVWVAQMRRLKVGDKLAGRHGNKGVISRILPREDMPMNANGEPVDIILNPLGIISRMNLGQVFEVHLGQAALELGYRPIAPAFEGPTWPMVQKELEQAGFETDGKIQLYDGRTGDPFDMKTVIGNIYILKLLHLVEDKMHARSIGPYSIVTQQPLGGKAQFGGQRFGEMEVWALEAHGAAHFLQELLTIKSDDIVGRAQTYKAIIKGEKIEKPKAPESFNVLIKELQSLGLKVELLK